jgi:hypothetical protein
MSGSFISSLAASVQREVLSRSHRRGTGPIVAALTGVPAGRIVDAALIVVALAIAFVSHALSRRAH